MDRAFSWLEDEFKCYQELYEYWKALKDKVDEVVLIEGTHILKRDIRFVGRAEKRFNKYEKRIEPEMKAIFNKLPFVDEYATAKMILDNVKKKLKEINVEAKNLLVDSSLHTGRLYGHFEHINHALKKHEIEQAHQAVIDMGEIIQDGLRWIRALTIELKKIKTEDLPKLEEEIRREQEELEKRKREQVEAMKKKKGELEQKKQLEIAKAKVRKELPILDDLEKALRFFRKADNLLEKQIFKFVDKIGNGKLFAGNLNDLHGAYFYKTRSIVIVNDFSQFKAYLENGEIALIKAYKNKDIFDNLASEYKKALTKSLPQLPQNDNRVRDMEFAKESGESVSKVIELLRYFLRNVTTSSGMLYCQRPSQLIVKLHRGIILDNVSDEEFHSYKNWKFDPSLLILFQIFYLVVRIIDNTLAIFADLKRYKT